MILALNILRIMNNLGMSVTVLPWNTSAKEVTGDTAAVFEAVEEVRKLLGKLPIFGICLDHQILSLVLECETYKLNCGHHGGNHPVVDYSNNKIEINSNNHGFSVDEKSHPESVSATHRNLDDKIVEGIESLTYPAFTV